MSLFYREIFVRYYKLHAKQIKKQQVKIGRALMSYNHVICQTSRVDFIRKGEHSDRAPIGFGAGTKRANKQKFNFTCVKLVIVLFAIITLKK